MDEREEESVTHTTDRSGGEEGKWGIFFGFVFLFPKIIRFDAVNIFGLKIAKAMRHSQVNMERRRWRRQRKRHSRETTQRNEEKSVHNKMICYTPVAYGIRKIDCFLIIKTRERIYILMSGTDTIAFGRVYVYGYLDLRSSRDVSGDEDGISVSLSSYNWLYFNSSSINPYHSSNEQTRKKYDFRIVSIDLSTQPNSD